MKHIGIYLSAAALLAALQVGGESHPHCVEEARGYNSWPMIQAVGGRLICVYRMGTKHNPGERGCGTYARSSDDGGKTWGGRVVVAKDPTWGVTAIAKGLDGSGAALFWVRRYGAKRLFALYRTEDGERFELVSEPELDRGPWMQITDIFSVPGIGLMSFWFGGSYADDDRPRRWGVTTSADNGTNWTFRVIGENMKRAFWPTEPSGVYLGDGRILAVARTEHGGRQLQLTSADFGRTWTVRETNIRDVSLSTPSLVYDSDSGIVSNYYYDRGKSILRRRCGMADELFDNPMAWPNSEVVAVDNNVKYRDSGNVNATSSGNRHYVTWYAGRAPDCAVLVLSPAPSQIK